MYSTHGYDSEDEYCPRNVCLDVGELSADTDLTKTPTSGQEYLQQVVLEASKYRDVVVANIDRSKLKKQNSNSNYGYWNFIPEAPPARDDLKPTKAWQSHQMENFLALKSQVESIKAKLSEDGINDLELVNLPKAEREKKWKALVLEQKIVPSLKLMLSFDQVRCENLIIYVNEWIEQKLIDIWEVGPLLYSVFVCMEMPLDSSIVFNLRTLARHCAFTRVQENNLDDKKLATLNLFICIISNFFAQKDLMDARSDGL
ncbi:unnamed protein product [Bemisia tabaci]|uniref:Gem-associated protein 2 n=1 Tax=Bemisia tabaci TaxID=7038 RepID=A0A9P0F7U4_BEMTA|nr:unnamed protein product [Bemisia tabaci]